MPKTLELIGHTFGRLTVVERLPNSTNGQVRWRCQCACGGEWSGPSGPLRQGLTSSCGCLRREVWLAARTKHGGSKHSPLYSIWKGVGRRCSSPKCKAWADYGGRGIKRCSRWSDFAMFEADMLPTYVAGMTLERKNVDGDYSPDNCIWIPRGDQNRNTTRTLWVEIDGQRLCLAEAARLQGLNYDRVKARLRLGYDLQTAMQAPPGTLGVNLVRVTTPDGVASLKVAVRKFGTVSYTVASVRIGDGWDPWKAITTPFPKPKETLCLPTR